MNLTNNQFRTSGVERFFEPGEDDLFNPNDF
jgi:hypothetical protein